MPETGTNIKTLTVDINDMASKLLSLTSRIETSDRNNKIQKGLDALTKDPRFGNPDQAMCLKGVIGEMKALSERMTGLSAMITKADEYMELQRRLAALFDDPTLRHQKPPQNGQEQPSRPSQDVPCDVIHDGPETPPDAPQGQTEPAQMLTPPKYEPGMLAMMKSMPDEWTDAKIKAVIERPGVHPDSIDKDGRVMQGAWTWSQVKYATANYMPDIDLRSMTITLCHAPEEIRELLTSLGIQVSARQDPNLPDDLETFMPHDCRFPTMNARLRILRLYTRTPATKIANALKLPGGTNSIMALESGAKPLRPDYIRKIESAMNLPRGSMAETPIGELVKLSSAKSVTGRLAIIRIRMGLSATEMADMLGIELNRYVQYESEIQQKDLEIIMDKLGLDMRLFADLLPGCEKPAAKSDGKSPTQGLDMDEKSTGDKLRDIRLACKMSPMELARKSGLSVSHISNIENGRTNPSETAVSKMAVALGCTPMDIIGRPNRNAATNMEN